VGFIFGEKGKLRESRQIIEKALFKRVWEKGCNTVHPPARHGARRLNEGEELSEGGGFYGEGAHTMGYRQGSTGGHCMSRKLQIIIKGHDKNLKRPRKITIDNGETERTVAHWAKDF